MGVYEFLIRAGIFEYPMYCACSMWSLGIFDPGWKNLMFHMHVHVDCLIRNQYARAYAC